MSKYVQTNCGLFVHGLNLSADADVGFNAVALAVGAEAVPSTRYVVAGNAARRFSPGLRTAKMEAQGYFNSVEDAALLGTFSAETITGLPGFAVTAAPDGVAVGDPAYFMRATTGSYSPFGGGEMGSMLQWRFEAAFRGLESGEPEVWKAGAVNGVVAMNASGAGTGAGAALQLGAVGAGQRIYAAVHVLDAVGGVHVDIESDDNAGFTSPTQRIDMSPISVSGSGTQSALGPITDDYWRANIVVGSSADVLVVLGIL